MSAATFSLRMLMVFVAALAVGCYALTQHTPLWANVIVTMSYGLLALAALLAFVRRGARRAFWTGLAVAGWAYSAIVFSPFLFTGSGALLTTKVLIVGWAHVGTGPPTPRTSEPPPLSTRDMTNLENDYFEIMMGFRSSFVAEEQQDYVAAIRAYFRIGQSLWAIILGLGAGLTTAALYRREQWLESGESRR